MTDEPETAREAFERLIAMNPRFKAAPRTGKATAIIGARPTGATAAVGDDAQSVPAEVHPARKGAASR